MKNLLAFAIAFTRAWVATYTRGLPPHVRAERREEIDCDLWHQQRLSELQREPVTGTAAQVLLRLLLGFPDDIFWRLEAGASARSGRKINMLTNESLPMRGLVAAGLFVSLFLASIGVASVVAGLLDPEGGFWVGGAITALAGIATTVGLLVSRRSPLIGIALVAAGSITIVFVWSWLFVFTVPVGAAMIVIAVLRARGTGWPRSGGVSPPTAAAA